jgi:two-component system OmpR family sensor kinase
MKATTKSIIFFMIVYLGSLGILGTGMGYLYYVDEKQDLVDKMRFEMRYKIKSINAKLEYYHKYHYDSFIFYEEGYDIALYDNNKELIASNFTNGKMKFEKLFYNVENKYYLIDSLYDEYLDVKYIVVRKTLDQKKIDEIIQKILIRAGLGFIFLLFVALILSHIMLRPIRQSIHSLKTFMKDATHEMNTPISTILMSYEHLDKENLTQKQLRSLDRIDIASKTLSGIYNDLSFASFHHYIEYQDTPLNVKEVIDERVKYLSTLLSFKGLHITCDMKSKIIHMDKRKLVLIIDNLLSNAIKFTKKDGLINVTLTDEYLSVKDNGIGISEEDQKTIFKRFRSKNSLHGGFGVGLDIVYQICKEYHIKIELDSTVGKGSEFKLIWKD